MLNILILNLTPKKTVLGSQLRLNKLIKFWNTMGVKCCVLNTPSWMSRFSSTTGILLWLLYAPLKIIELNKRLRFHVVLCNSHNFYNLFPAYFSSKILSMPHIVTVHHIPEVELETNPLRIFKMCRREGFKETDSLLFSLIFPVNRKIISHFKYIVTVSTASKRSIERVAGGTVKVSRNGIDDSIQVIADHFVNVSKMYEAIYIGRLDPAKGIFDLVGIWDMVSKRAAKARLIIIGSGYEKYVQRIQTMIKNQGLSKNIMLVGSVSDKDKFSLLSQSKVFVLPSHAEGFSLVISEALWFKLPVVTYELPALVEIYDHCPAVSYVELGDKEKFMEAILYLLQRDGVRVEKGEVGLRFVEELAQRLSWKKVAEDLLLFLSNIPR